MRDRETTNMGLVALNRKEVACQQHPMCSVAAVDFMRVVKNSVTVEELFEDGDGYKLWDADLWQCPDCGVQVITGFAREPLAEHWQPTYHVQRDRLAPIYPGRCRAAKSN